MRCPRISRFLAHSASERAAPQRRRPAPEALHTSSCNSGDIAVSFILACPWQTIATRAQRPNKGPCSAFEAESTHFSKDIKIRTRAVAAKGIVTTRLTTLTVSPLATCPSHGAASIHKSAAAARRRFHGAIFETHGLEPFEGEGTLRVCCFVLLIRTDARAAGV